MVPGEMTPAREVIVINEGRNTCTLKVTNTGDRAIQVGSHFHFFEVNKALKFDREKAYGTRLDIASGTSVRFEPGEEKEVDLVMVGGTQRIFGFNGLTEGQINYIIEFYGGSKTIIANIERELNLIGIIDNKDDYFEVICSVVAQKEILREELKKCTIAAEAKKVYVANQKLIVNELNRRYNNLEQQRPDEQTRMKSFC